MSEHQCTCGHNNPYLPELATVVETVQETPTIKSIRVRFDNEEAWDKFTYQPGSGGAVVRVRRGRIHLRHQHPAFMQGLFAVFPCSRRAR